MTFVYPLLLGGLLLAAVPVLLHFLIRQKPKTLLFPAYRFLLLKRRSNTRNLRLRHFLLLLLRVGLIVLICLALARPRLFQEQLGILDRERPLAMIFVIDTTPSMDYQVAGQTRLELAKQRAVELLDELPADSRFLVLDAADSASADREDFIASADRTRQRITALTIRPESVPVTAALARALERFDAWDDPAGQKLPRFVCVFTDRTRPSWDAKALAKRSASEDAVPVRTLLFDVGVPEPTDVAIVQADFFSARQVFRQGEKIPVRVLVKATGKSSDATLQVKIDGKEALQQPVSVAANETQTVALEIDSAALKLAPGQHHLDIAQPTADALAFNNQRFVTFSIQKKPKILVLADDLKATRRVATILEDFHYDVEHRPARDAGDLGPFEAVFLVSVASPSEQLWQALKAFVDGGHSIAVIPGGAELQIAAYNSPEAQKILPGTIVGPVRSKSRDGAIWDLLSCDRGHSFLQPYIAWLQRGNVEFVEEPRHATRYWDVKPDKKEYTVVAFDEDARPAVLEKATTGKVLMLTTPLDDRNEEWNDYGHRLTTFRLALLMMLGRHLCASAQEQPLNFEFGVRPPVVRREGRAFAKYALKLGENAEEIAFDERNVWRGDRLGKAGNYTIWGENPEQNERAEIAKFSVNTPGVESDLSRVPDVEIEAALGKDAIAPLDRKIPLMDSLHWNEPVELFPWLMIGLLFLLALENLLANRFYRAEPEA